MDKFNPRLLGVRQGCPLSPTLFAMLISPIIQRLQGISTHITVLLYGDDLLIIIHDTPSASERHMVAVKAERDTFSGTTGLSLNSSKSGILVKGSWVPVLVLSLRIMKIPVKNRCKYPDVFIGHISPEVAYDPALQKALGRAFSVQDSKLSLAERVELQGSSTPWLQ
mmetsp:Transcript_112900/g.196005  ORF Transcript_112900/g.196005 Transcript_112900/m.196005 type:complete len:167 (-) Transcript_112900:345-845(-)